MVSGKVPVNLFSRMLKCCNVDKEYDEEDGPKKLEGRVPSNWFKPTENFWWLVKPCNNSVGRVPPS
eukprot:scaffold49186_cov38-Attheya_sp.AAC.1